MTEGRWAMGVWIPESGWEKADRLRDEQRLSEQEADRQRAAQRESERARYYMANMTWQQYFELPPEKQQAIPKEARAYFEQQHPSYEKMLYTQQVEEAAKELEAEEARRFWEEHDRRVQEKREREKDPEHLRRLKQSNLWNMRL